MDDVNQDATHKGVTFALNQLDTVSCNFRNQPTLGSITVKKETLGGTSNGFNFTATGPNGVNQSFNNVSTLVNNPSTAGTLSGLYPGQYVVTETALPNGWSLDSIVCGGAAIDLGTKKATITVPPTGGNVDCTFKNKPNVGSLLVEKQTVGGVGPFTFTLTGQANKSVTTVAQNVFTAPGSGTWTGLTPGNFTIDETNPDSSWIEGPFTCKVGATTVASGNGPLVVPVGAGQQVVCQVTNTKKGSITVRKATVGDVGSFGFTLTGQTGRTVVTTQQNTFTAGTPWSDLPAGAYTIDETFPGAAWVEGTFSCNYVGSQAAPVVGAAPVINLAAGQAWTCDITNTKKGSLLVEKQTVGSTGTFDFTLSGQSAKTVTTTSQNVFTAPATGAWTNLTPGSFNLAETDPDSSWIEGAFDCKVAGNTVASGSGSLSVPVGAGEAVVCRITNTKKGSLLVEKQTIGGTGTFEFTLSGQANKSVTTTAQNVFTPPASGAWTNLVPGSFNLDEINPDSSWIEGTFECKVGASIVASGAGALSVPVGTGQAVVCRITNTKKGSLLVQKQTIGSTGTFEFTLSGQSAKNVTTTSQNVYTDPASGAWTNLTPGSFDLAETDPDNSWIEGDFTCKVGTDTVASGSGSLSVPVGAGQAVVCRITNTKKGSLLVEKQTIGSTGTFDFTLSGQANKSVTTAAQNVFTPPASGAWTNLAPGSFNLAETDPDSSWIEGAFDCKVAGNTVASGSGTLSVPVGAGEAVVCRVTNTKKGSITVRKATVGDVGSFSFTLTGQTGRTVVTTQQNTFTAGTPWSDLAAGAYTIAETDPGASWVKGTFSCNYAGLTGRTDCGCGTGDRPHVRSGVDM